MSFLIGASMSPSSPGPCRDDRLVSLHDLAVVKRRRALDVNPRHERAGSLRVSRSSRCTIGRRPPQRPPEARQSAFWSDARTEAGQRLVEHHDVRILVQNGRVELIPHCRV